MAYPIYFRDPVKYQRMLAQGMGARNVRGSIQQALGVIQEESRRKEVDLARMLAQNELLDAAMAEDVILGKSVGAGLGKTLGGVANALYEEFGLGEQGQVRPISTETTEDATSSLLRQEEERRRKMAMLGEQFRSGGLYS